MIGKAFAWQTIMRLLGINLGGGIVLTPAELRAQIQADADQRAEAEAAFREFDALADRLTRRDVVRTQTDALAARRLLAGLPDLGSDAGNHPTH